MQIKNRGGKFQDNRYIVIKTTFNIKRGNKMEIQETMTNHIYHKWIGC